MSAPLALFRLPGPAVDARDCWRTDPRVLRAPLMLLGRERFDLDAASEPGLNPLADHCITREMDAHRTVWGRAGDLVWCNPPFSGDGGGKVAWSRLAWTWAQRGRVVCLLLPVWGDRYAAQLDAVCSVRISLTPRVRFLPPPGVQATSPNQTPHAIWVLGWRGADRLSVAWDWECQRWVEGMET